MNICIFEDFLISNLAPVNYLRHTSKIICGATTLLEKITDNFPSKVKLTLHTRKYLAEYCQEKFPKANVNNLIDDEYIFLNSRVLFNKQNLKEIAKTFKKQKNSALIQDKTVIAFHTTKEKTIQFREVVNTGEENLISAGDIDWLGLNKIPASDFKVINYASDLIVHLEEELHKDLKHLSKRKLYIAGKNKISKQVVFDTSKGSIYIGKNTVIEPFTYIKGPVYIGDNCTIRSGTRLQGPVRIGNWCKVSGEVTSSILHWYVNKQHLGFLGHSYLCEWVNLGAGTTTSNLKNNFAKISLEIAGQKIDTGSIFIGSIIGDLTKTGIQTMLNTGTLAGVSSNLYGAGYHKNLVKSFVWANASADKSLTYQIDKAINTAKLSMARRDMEMSKAYEDMLRNLFSIKDDLPV